MYSGKHFGGGLAAACRSGAVGAGEQREPDANSDANTCAHSNTYAHSDPNSHADANPDPDSHAYTHTDPDVRRRRLLCSPMEFHDCISGRQCGQRRQQQLYGAVLQPGFESNDRRQQRPSGHR
jgi:hypothetical protein